MYSQISPSLTAQSYAKMLKIDKAHVIRVSGIRKEDEYEIERDAVSDEVIRKPLGSSN